MNTYPKFKIKTDLGDMEFMFVNECALLAVKDIVLVDSDKNDWFVYEGEDIIMYQDNDNEAIKSWGPRWMNCSNEYRRKDKNLDEEVWNKLSEAITTEINKVLKKRGKILLIRAKKAANKNEIDCEEKKLEEYVKLRGRCDWKIERSENRIKKWKDELLKVC